VYLYINTSNVSDNENSPTNSYENQTGGETHSKAAMSNESENAYIDSLTFNYQQYFTPLDVPKTSSVQRYTPPNTVRIYIQKLQSERSYLNELLVKHDALIEENNKLASALFIRKQLNIHLENYKKLELISQGKRQYSSDVPHIFPWQNDKENKQQALAKLQTYIQPFYALPTKDPKRAALLIASGFTQPNIYTCPILEENGSWLKRTHPLYQEIMQVLPPTNQDKQKATHFLIGKVVSNDNGHSKINYQLVDEKNSAISSQQINFIFEQAIWGNHGIPEQKVLLDIDSTLKARPNGPNTIHASAHSLNETLYQLVGEKLLPNQNVIAVDPCKPIALFSNDALHKAYGTYGLVSVKISGKISTKVSWPDPIEHQVAHVEVNVQHRDINGAVQMRAQHAMAKHYPVVTPYDGLLAATEKALTKLR